MNEFTNSPEKTSGICNRNCIDTHTFTDGSQNGLKNENRCTQEQKRKRTVSNAWGSDGPPFAMKDMGFRGVVFRDIDVRVVTSAVIEIAIGGARR